MTAFAHVGDAAEFTARAAAALPADPIDAAVVERRNEAGAGLVEVVVGARPYGRARNSPRRARRCR